jgi:hypothetical protein
LGGIAATCAEAFRPYSPVLANLTGVCSWWGWVPTCGFTAILSATALHEWYLPFIPITPLAIGVVLAFTAINLLAAMATSAEDRTIVEAIVKMAAGLRIDVVAEGVETIEQADSLTRLGCLLGQGFYYARPMPSDGVPAVLGSSLPLADAGPPALAGVPSLER